MHNAAGLCMFKIALSPVKILLVLYFHSEYDFG